MCDWTACPGVNSELLAPEDSIEPLPSASLKHLSYLNTLTLQANEKLAELAKGHILANTSKSTKWALNVFELWSTARNQSHTEEPVPEDLFTCNNPGIPNESIWFVQAITHYGQIVPAYVCPEAGKRCPVSILDMYLSKLSPETVENDLFYVRPLEQVLEQVLTNPLDLWYASIPVGRDTLRKKTEHHV